MNRFKMIFTAVMAASTICSAALIPSDSVEVTGIDVRNKSEKYVLYIGKENIVLEERTYKLMKYSGNKRQLIAQGAAVFAGADLENDTEALWVNEEAQIKIGRMIGSKKPKQIVVLKLKNLNRTFAFEMFHD